MSSPLTSAAASPFRFIFRKTPADEPQTLQFLTIHLQKGWSHDFFWLKNLKFRIIYGMLRSIGKRKNEKQIQQGSKQAL